MASRFGLFPFMIGHMSITGKKEITLSHFEKPVDVKMDLDKKTLLLLREVMKKEGYGSIDETISNVIHKVWCKKTNSKDNYHIAYIYPEGFLESGIDLIHDYKKRTQHGSKRKGKGK